MPLQKSTMWKCLLLAWTLLALHSCWATLSGQNFVRMRSGLSFNFNPGFYCRNRISCAAKCLWTRSCKGFCYREAAQLCSLSEMEYFTQMHFRLRSKEAVIYFKVNTIKNYDVVGDKIFMKIVRRATQLACNTTCKYLDSTLPLPLNAEENVFLATYGEKLWLRVASDNGSLLELISREPLTYENWENDGPFLVKNDPLRVTLDPGGYWGTSDKNKEDFCMCEKMVSKCPRSVVDQACFMMN